MYIHRHIVSATFRTQVSELLPGLSIQTGYWALFGNMAFGTFVDSETREPIVSREFLAQVSGNASRWHHARGGNAGKFLDAFSHDVFTVEYSKPSGIHGVARRITRADIPSEIQTLIEAEMRYNGDDWVYLDTGNRWSKEARAAENRILTDYLAEVVAAAQDHPAVELIAHLNSIPSHRFAKLVGNIDDAHQLCDELGLPSQNHRTLKAIRNHPKPVYGPSIEGATARIFGIRDGLTNLRKELRSVVTRGWHEADLRSAQLAICAAESPVGWNVPEIRDFLESGQSVWSVLLNSMGLPASIENKRALKDALYGVCYGQGDKGRDEYFAEHLPNVENANQRFKAIPLVKTMLHARRKRMKAIQSDGGAYDAFGVWHDVRQVFNTDRPRERRTNLPSICALIAQSWELRLLLPVLSLATSSAAEHRQHGFVLTLWQHDGISIDCQPASARRWKRELSEAVAAEAHRLGIPTSLDWI